MNCLSWNYYSLGQSCAILELTNRDGEEIQPVNNFPHGDKIKGVLLEETLFESPSQKRFHYPTC